MDQFLITGGRPLSGEIEAGGAKNAAFPLLAACLLTSEECRISNLPLIEDIFRMLEIIKSLGAEVEWPGKREVRIKAKDIDPSRINRKLVLLLRGSILLLGPLLARFGKVEIPKPGGCIIGARPVDTHLDAFRQLGAETEVSKKKIKVSLRKKKIRAKVILNEFSVTATENLMLFSALNQGEIKVKTADCDYQVQELARFLNKMGAKVKGQGAHELEIRGSGKLKGAKHKLMYDPMEAGTFILASAATKGRVLVKNVELPFLEFPLKKLRDFRIPVEVFRSAGNLASVRVSPWKSLRMDKIQSLPFPGIPSDLQSAFGVLATQAKGSTLIHDPLYEGRLKYLEDLTRMGAEIYFADPHRAVINGPTPLFGREIKSADLRGGAALIIAALAARGKTNIGNIYQIDRGYEKIEEKLSKLGANIKRICS